MLVTPLSQKQRPASAVVETVAVVVVFLMLLFGVLEEVHEITESMVDTTAEELQQDLEGGASELSDLPVPPAHRANGGSNGAAISDVLHRIEVLEQQMASREQVFRRLTSLLGVR